MGEYWKGWFSIEELNNLVLFELCEEENDNIITNRNLSLSLSLYIYIYIYIYIYQ